MDGHVDVVDSTAYSDNDEDEDDIETQEESDVQLGFIDKTTKNALFHDCDWRNWDGGKVGGHPVRESGKLGFI